MALNGNLDDDLLFSMVCGLHVGSQVGLCGPVCGHL